MTTTEDRIESAIAFISGDFLTMFILWIHFDAIDIVLKVAATGVLGGVGGFAGLLGKDLYNITKDKISKWKNKETPE